MRRFIAATAVLFVALPAMAAAQGAKPTLPTVAQVMDGYVAAMGGKTAIEAIRSTHSKGTLRIDPMGLTGSFESYEKSGKILSVQNITSIGEVRQGYDGAVAWSSDPMNGVRTLDGAELALLKRGTGIASPLKWRDQYTGRVLGQRLVGGRKVWAVQLTPKQGKPITQYHDTRDYMLVGLDMVVESAMATIPAKLVFSDYRSVGGAKIPFTVQTKVGGMADLTMKVTDYTVNAEVDDSVFARPAEKPLAPAGGGAPAALGK